MLVFFGIGNFYRILLSSMDNLSRSRSYNRRNRFTDMKYQVIKEYSVKSVGAGIYRFKVGDVFEGTERNGYVYLELRNYTIPVPLDYVTKTIPTH